MKKRLSLPAPRGTNQFSSRISFKNPFRTSSRKTQRYTTYRSPIHRTGITSLERAEQERLLSKINEWKNAGMYDSDDEKWFSTTFKDFGDVATYPLDKDLPRGVTNVENMEALRSASRQIQAANAGILSAEMMKKKRLYDILRKRKEKEMKDKTIQYIAESDELDEVPEELREEVNSYLYRGVPLQYRMFLNTDRKSFGIKNADELKKEGIDLEKNPDMAKKYRDFNDWKDKHSDDFSALQKRFISYGKAEEKRAERRKKKQNLDSAALEKEFADYFLERKKIDEQRAQEEDRKRRGFGLIESDERIPRLYMLTRPLAFPAPTVDHEGVVQREKDFETDLKDEYKSFQKDQRGIEPPNEMVNRAVPKYARPLNGIFDPAPIDIVVPHPFVFPQRKFFVKTWPV